MTDQCLEELKLRLRKFAQVRDWEQFHSPKNLSMALSVEVAELVEHFQWLTEEQSVRLDSQEYEEVAFEMADIFIFLLRLSDQMDINLMEVARRKIELNEQRYPVDKVKGSSRKYDKYE